MEKTAFAILLSQRRGVYEAWNLFPKATYSLHSWKFDLMIHLFDYPSRCIAFVLFVVVVA